MLIDWFTIAAQVINFMILLVLLKIFLFDKIKAAMDKRARDIKQQFATADEQKEEAEKALNDYREKIRKFQDQKSAELTRAENEAKERRETLIKEARQEVDTLKKNWQNSLDEQKASFFERFQKQAAGLIFDAVKKTLTLLADTDAQDKAVKHFLTHLEALAQEKLPQQPLETGPRVLSGFKLSRDQQESIQQAFFQKLAEVKPLKKDQGTDQETQRQAEQIEQIEFEVKPELIFGIALFAGDKKISWHAKNYIETLERKLTQAIEGRENE